WLKEFNVEKVTYHAPRNVQIEPITSTAAEKAVERIVEEIPSSPLKCVGPLAEKAFEKANFDPEIMKDDIAFSLPDTENESLMQPLTKELTNSLLPETVVLQPIEPMDCGSSKS